MKTIQTNTGKILIEEYSKGELETLTIGDYGKSKNIKADFLGFTKDINGVPNGQILPLTEKWVITLSTQYGCPQTCKFCDVPNIKFRGNATELDMKNQINNAIKETGVKYTDRLNIHFARMGEPMWNFKNVYDVADYLSTVYFREDMLFDHGLRIETIHPVLTTMLPKKVNVYDTIENLKDWCYLKNRDFLGAAGLQLSINSTSQEQRDDMFNEGSHTLEDISKICKELPNPLGRKYTLNFALADGYETDGKILRELFDPKYFMVKITPIHNNTATSKNGIKTDTGYTSFTPYKDAEKSFKDAGFDVLIFIPSQDEEDGCITCGNAILAGSEIKTI